MPSAEEFAEFFWEKKPLVVKDGARHWPALERWTLDYLKEKAGSSLVPVELGGTYLDADMERLDMPLASYVDYLASVPTSETPPRAAAAYMAQAQVPALCGDDAPRPSLCRSAGRGDAYATSVWLGPKGTVTPLHRDPYHNCLAQVIGRKRVLLFDPRLDGDFYASADRLQPNSSVVDAEAPDMDRFPRFPRDEGRAVVLDAGDVLYIPKRWWHHVRSLSRSLSVSFWWL